MKRGLISIGTNSTRAIVAEFGHDLPDILLHRSTGTRIGEGLKERGHLDDTAMQRTLDAIAEHAGAIREHTAAFGVIATSALRRADNEAAFEERVRAITGTGVSIISGEEEAACSFAGAVIGIDASPDETLGVLDVGGGSSEFAAGTKSGPHRMTSCEVGAVRLTEAFPILGGTGGAISADVLERAAQYARDALEPALAFERVSRLVLVGGTATNTVSLQRGNREMFRYAQLSAAEIDATIARLIALRLEERKALPGINPQRADILPGGLLIVRQFMRGQDYRIATVSTSDVLLGYLLRHPPER